jgi:hypothetical protein
MSTTPPLNPFMMRMALASLGLLVVCLVGLVSDARVIAGAPAWLKPAKFGASGAIYLATLAWMMREVPHTRLRRFAEQVLSVIIVAETVVIMGQAARGRLSHFNVDSPLDVAIFSGMGIGIATVWVLSAVLLVLHLRTPARDRSLAIAFRLGLALNIAGAGVGWMMTQPRPEQLAAIERGERPFVVGSHTVGAPDGGPGMPLTRWSRDFGDLRVAHFLGMHALQLLPLFVLGLRGLRSRRNDVAELGLLGGAAAACGVMFVAALLQALAGHPVFPSSFR